MRALYWNGVNDLRVETVPDPTIVNPHDAILKVTLSTTCGSDLHFIDGYIPTMKPGDVIGHEFMGEVVETGPEVKKVKKGDRVVVPSFIVLRPVLVLPARALLAVRQHEPEARAAGADVRLPDGRHLRLHPRLRRLRRRRTREYVRVPVRRHRLLQGPGGRARRAGAVPLRRRAHRLHGRRLLRHQARRHGRRLGLRRRRADGAAERLPAGGRAGDRHRPLPRAAAAGAREVRLRDDQLHGGRQRRRDAQGDDRRPRARRLHRRGRAWRRTAPASSTPTTA